MESEPQVNGALLAHVMPIQLNRPTRMLDSINGKEGEYSKLYA
jgi:hypothetical protein